MSVNGIVVWGLGKHALNRILPALSSMDDLSLIGVCSRNGKTVDDWSAQYHCRGWTSPEKMLTDPDVDIVYIATPIGMHSELAVQALNSGKHVWCEKPLTCNYDDTLMLVHLAKQKELVLTEAFMFLHHPQFKDISRFVRANEAGQAHSIICRFGIPALDEPGFRLDPKLCGGALWDVASYTVAAVLALFPQQQVQVLFAEVLKDEDALVDVEGRALLRFSEGATAYLEWGIGLAYRNEIDIWSDQGSFSTEKIFSKPVNYQPVYQKRDNNGNMSLENGVITEQFVEMFHYFYDVLNSSQQASAECELILKRAQLMDDIIRFTEQ